MLASNILEIYPCVYGESVILTLHGMGPLWDIISSYLLFQVLLTYSLHIDMGDNHLLEYNMTMSVQLTPVVGIDFGDGT